MADVQVFFNRPSNPLDHVLLLDDIASATQRLALVSAWFTDTDIADGFVKSPAYNKIGIFSRHDLSRGNRKAVEIVRDYLQRAENVQETAREAIVNIVRQLKKQSQEYQALREKLYLELDESDGWEWGQHEWDRLIGMDKEFHNRAVEQIGIRGDRIITFSSIGGEDWREGVMHHKFVVADSVVWFGSFNFTFNAKNNYETLARVTDDATAQAFWEEAERMANDDAIWGEYTNGNSGGTLFRCEYCGNLFSFSNGVWIGSHGAMACIACDTLVSKITASVTEKK